MISPNRQIHSEDLPQVEELVFLPLETKYRTVMLISRCTFLLVLAMGLTGFLISGLFVVSTLLKYALIAALILFSIWSFFYISMAFRHKNYALREKDIVYRTGWLWRTMTTAPFCRVQHVSIDQGPIERQFGLARLRIFTAGGNTSDLTIPGLKPQRANELKEFIVKKTGIDEEE